MSNDLIPLENPNVPALFTPGGLSEILSKIEEDALALVPDLSTAKGRDAIASTAARVARSKTYLDGLGKDYVAQLKDLPRKIDAERKAMRDRLDALRDKVRAPLTEWEEAEHEKAALTERLIINLGGAVPFNTPIAKIEARLQEAMSLEIPDSLHPEQRDLIAKAQVDAVNLLQNALATVRSSEARVEAEKQAREAELAQKEADRKRLQAELDAVRKAAAEEKAKADVEAQRMRMEADAETARMQAEIKAMREAEAKRQAEADAKILEERRKAAAEQAEIQRQADAARLERENSARLAQEDGHRKAVHDEIAIKFCVIEPIAHAQALAIVNAIASGAVPCLTINY